MDLAAFFREVRSLQREGGAFLHLQDPNGDYLQDPELRDRMALQSKKVIPESIARFAPNRIAGRLFREIKGTQGEDYISKTNRALQAKGAVSEPLTVHELYAITDLHADHGDGKGISIEALKPLLPDYDCVSTRSYGFFGQLWSTLPAARKQMEERLIAEHAANGFHIAAAWRVKS
jgi:hypothetical protein